jgi:hypothetical protein
VIVEPSRTQFQATSLYWWCAAAAGLGLCLALLAHRGARGLYCDDYGYKWIITDVATGEWKPRLILDPYSRPLGQPVMANLAAAIPNREVLVRVLLALAHCTNAILVGLFAYRLVPSPLAALFAFLFFLVPVPAHESLLWLVAAGV